MKISFGSGHDHASLVSSPGLNATGEAPRLSLRSGDEDHMPLKLFRTLVPAVRIYLQAVRSTPHLNRSIW